MLEVREVQWCKTMSCLTRLCVCVCVCVCVCKQGDRDIEMRKRQTDITVQAKHQEGY